MKKIENFSFLAFFRRLPNIFTVFGDDFCVHKDRKKSQLGACVERAESGVGVDPSIYTRPRPPL